MLPIADSAAKSGVDMASLTQFPTSRFDEANKIASILTYADPLSDNGGESRARAVMIAGGYMLPHLQYQFPNMDNPEFPLRVDFIWFLPGDVTVVGEYDGMAKYGNTWTEVNTHVNKQCKRDDYLRKRIFGNAASPRLCTSVSTMSFTANCRTGNLMTRVFHACIDDERLRSQYLLVSSGQTPTAAYLLCDSLMWLVTRHYLPALRRYKAVRG